MMCSTILLLMPASKIRWNILLNQEARSAGNTWLKSQIGGRHSAIPHGKIGAPQFADGDPGYTTILECRPVDSSA